MADGEEAGVQPTEIGANGEQNGEDNKESSPCIAKMMAILLVVLGVGLYIYILYIAVSNLVFPGSFSPFLVSPVPKAAENVTDDPQVTRAILMDAALLWLFVAQHSFMACRALKRFFDRINMSAISRPLYIFSTCCAIQIIYQFWVSTPAHTLWQSDSSLLYYVLVAVHIASWISIACSVFTIDYLELLGIKQIYYSYNEFENPMYYKSAEQQQLLMHMRHPIFLAPAVILWAVPLMTYDRFLVAVLLPLYLAWGSTIDSMDVEYIKEQFHMKKAQLLVNNNKLD